jgi:hypothetical protein
MNTARIVKAMACCCAVTVLAGCFLSPSEPAKTGNEPSQTGSNADSLFSILIERVQTMDTVDSYDAFAATDFKNLQAGFAAAVANSSGDVKANVGLMISTLLSLNKSQRI